MNVESLENLLEEVQNLKERNPRAAEILKIRIIDSLREVKLFDQTASSLISLRFNPLNPRLADPYNRSMEIMAAILKSKIEILRSREQQTRTAELDEMQRDIMNGVLMQRLKEQENSFTNKIAKMEAENSELGLKLNSLQTDLEAQIATNLTLKKDNKRWIWFLKLTSAGMWAFIISSFIAIAIWMYELGKDNATKSDDTEKANLRKSNTELLDSVDILKLEIDSFKKINKKG